jgi:5-methylcytosine-specific restriction endonuclease McrBC regulatory subunit McrC
MQTWQVWEQLVALSLRNALSPKNVLLQSPKRLGTRTQDGEVRVLNVVPDAIVAVPNTTGSRRIIVDAKYKGHVDRTSTSISNADIYESLAFSRATGIFEVVLVYPRTVDDAPSSHYEVGHAAEFARAVADGVLIRAVELGVCRISERGGLKRFADALAKSL